MCKSYGNTDAEVANSVREGEFKKGGMIFDLYFKI